MLLLRKGHLAKMAKLADISYADMLHKILKAGERRCSLDMDPQSYEKINF
jgi:hypothetical protein